MPERAELIEQVLALAAEDRAFVADALEQSLLDRTVASPEVAAVWSREIDRRIAAYDRGETVALEFDAAVEHLQHALAAHRAGLV